jgi:cyclopropane-fatty-acyl-phospholipid synthase
LFVHIFTHRYWAYPFETEGEDNWMGRYFFTGGLMPSRDLLPRFRVIFNWKKQWHFNGRHYQRTLEAWLVNQDRHREAEIMALFARDLRFQGGGTLVSALAGVFHGLR